MNMKPETTQEPFVEVEIFSETFFIPLMVYDKDDHGPIISQDDDKWFTRLTMPGYLDSTEWQGPYNSEIEALKEIYNDQGYEEESFTQFINGGVMQIVEGTLAIHEVSNGYHLVGKEHLTDNEDTFIAHMGDGIDFMPPLSLGEAIEHSYYNPNDDPDLDEAHKFELVSEELSQ